MSEIIKQIDKIDEKKKHAITLKNKYTTEEHKNYITEECIFYTHDGVGFSLNVENKNHITKECILSTHDVIDLDLNLEKKNYIIKEYIFFTHDGVGFN